MRVLQAGYSKSGNYWLWNIIDKILRYAGVEQRSFIQSQPIYPLAKTWELSFPEQADIDFLEIWRGVYYYRILPMFRMSLEDIEDYVRQTTHVWTHSPYQAPEVPFVASLFDRMVLLVRDPRDCALSMASFDGTPFKRRHYGHTPRDMGRHVASVGVDWPRQVAPYLLHRDELGLHVVYYERLVHCLDSEISELVRYLGVDLSPDTIARIGREVTFSSMKSHSPHHVARGETARWVKMLAPDLQERIAHPTSPLLRLLNYPVTVEDARREELPRTPSLQESPHQRETLRAFLPDLRFRPEAGDMESCGPIEPGEVLRLGTKHLAYALESRSVDSAPWGDADSRGETRTDDVVYLYHKGNRLSLPGDCLPFVIELVRRRHLTAEAGLGWFDQGSRYGWPELRDILRYLVGEGVLKRTAAVEADQ